MSLRRVSGPSAGRRSSGSCASRSRRRAPSGGCCRARQGDRRGGPIARGGFGRVAGKPDLPLAKTTGGPTGLVVFMMPADRDRPERRDKPPRRSGEGTSALRRISASARSTTVADLPGKGTSAEFPSVGRFDIFPRRRCESASWPPRVAMRLPLSALPRFPPSAGPPLGGRRGGPSRLIIARRQAEDRDGAHLRSRLRGGHPALDSAVPEAMVANAGLTGRDGNLVPAQPHAPVEAWCRAAAARN